MKFLENIKNFIKVSKYHKMYQGYNNISVFIYKNKFGVIGKDNKVIIDPIYDNIHSIGSKDNIFITEINNKYGVITIDKKELLPNNYKSIKRFIHNTLSNMGIIFIKITDINNKSGVMIIDSRNKSIVSIAACRYDNILLDSSPYIYPILNGKVGLISILDKIKMSNKTININCTYDKICVYNNTDLLFLVINNDKLGIIDSIGKLIVPIEYNKIQMSKDYKYATALKEDKYYLLDIVNKKIVPIKQTLNDSNKSDVLLFTEYNGNFIIAYNEYIGKINEINFKELPEWVKFCSNIIFKEFKEKKFKEAHKPIELNPKILDFLIWSGGCDSTLLLYRLLKEGKKPIIIHFESNFLGKNKNIQERNAMNKLKEKFKNMGYNIDKEIDIKLDIKFNNYKLRNLQNKGVIQPQSWIMQTLPFVKDNSVIHFGYIKSDSIFKEGRIDELKSIFNSCCKLLGYDNTTMKYDLKNLSKVDIIKELKDLNLFEDAWYCESSKNDKPCNNCASCKEVNNAIKLLNK